MNTEDITVTLTRDQFDDLRQMVGRAERAYQSDREAWKKMPDLPNAAHNAEVLLKDYEKAVLMGQELTEAYVRHIEKLDEKAATV